MLKQHVFVLPAYVLALFAGDIAQFPSQLQPMIQQGYLETELDGYLEANNGYWVGADRDEFQMDVFEKNRGTTITRTRPGLKAPVVVATDNAAAQTGPNNGVNPSDFNIEQYTFSPFEISDGIDLDLIGTNFGIVDRFEHDLRATYHQGMQSVDLLARDTYIRDYATAATTATGAAAAGNGVTLTVDDIRGFDTVITEGTGSTNGTLQNVSATYTLPATVYPGGSETGAFDVTITGAVADGTNASKFVLVGTGYGAQGAPTAARGNGKSGTLTLNVPTGKAIAAGDVLVAGDAPAQIYAGGVLHYSKLVSGNTLASANILDAVSLLENNGVPASRNRNGETEGTYTCHIAPSVRRSLFKDADFKQANQTLGQSEIYKNGKVSQYLGVTFLPNTNAPRIALAGGGYAYLTIIAGEGAIVDSWYAGLENWAQNSMNPGYVVLDQGIAFILMPAYADRQGRRIHVDWLSIRDMVCPTDVTRSSVILTGTGGRRARAVGLWTYSAT